MTSPESTMDETRGDARPSSAEEAYALLLKLQESGDASLSSLQGVSPRVGRHIFQAPGQQTQAAGDDGQGGFQLVGKVVEDALLGLVHGPDFVEELGIFQGNGHEMGNGGEQVQIVFPVFSFNFVQRFQGTDAVA